MSDLTCPTGMVLINPSAKSVHPDEPAFCIDATEVTQAADAAFWAARQQSGYELQMTLTDGTTTGESSFSEQVLRESAATKILQGNVSSVTVRPIDLDKKRQPEGYLAGPKKPAIYRSWSDARAYCKARGGDLPTERQWEQACGGKAYCTASGELNHREAIYAANSPADVATTLPNAHGVYDMTGNVWEWMRDDYRPGSQYKSIRGGSWNDFAPEYLRAAFRNVDHPDNRGDDVGFRCVAAPQDSQTQTYPWTLFPFYHGMTVAIFSASV